MTDETRLAASSLVFREVAVLGDVHGLHVLRCGVRVPFDHEPHGNLWVRGRTQCSVGTRGQTGSA